MEKEKAGSGLLERDATCVMVVNCDLRDSPFLVRKRARNLDLLRSSCA
jgi:hypothetical protein